MLFRVRIAARGIVFSLPLPCSEISRRINRKSQSQMKQARTQAQIDRMKADEQRQRVIAEQINFLCEQCGFTVEQATEHVTGRKM